MKNVKIICIFSLLILPIWLFSQTPVQLIEFNDIAPGGGNYWTTPTEVSGRVFYQYRNSGNSNHYLYVTDGTTNGSSLLRTFNGPISAPHVINNNQYLFLADNDGDNRYEVWTSDGTVGGTTQLIEFSQVSGFGWPTPTVINNKVFYQNNTQSSTGHLYVTDGTTSGSSQLMSFNDIITYPHVKSQTQYLFWTDNDGDFMPELWTSNGTSGGTQQLFETGSVYAVGSPGPGIEAGGKMFYCYLAQTSSGELYVTDGTPGGSGFVGASITQIHSPHVIGNQFMFTTDIDYNAHGEIWTSDGTNPGTTMLFESTAPYYSAPPINTLVVGGRAYYHYLTNGFGHHLIASDGTAAGTNFLKTFSEVFVSHHTINGNQYLFIADDDNNNRLEIWTSNGSVGGTTQLFEFSDVTGSAFPSHYERNGRVYYHHTGFNNNSYYLASTNGTSGGTSQAFSSNQTIKHHHDINNFGGRYLFVADNDGDQKLEVWTSDGSSGGTTQIFEFAANAANNTPIVSEVNGVNYYQYENSGGGTSNLYVSDGTPAGSSNIGSFNGKINVPHSINGDQYLFIADNDQDGRQEVWSVSGLANIEDIKQQSTFQVYPNPTQDFITVSSDELFVGTSYSIIEITGKIVGSGVIEHDSSSTISLQDLPKGIYILQLSNKNLDKRFRIVKQ